MTNAAMIEKFLCPGCMCGESPSTCEVYRPVEEGHGLQCASHSAGTHVFPGGRIALGLPVGFNKYGEHGCPSDNRQDALYAKAVMSIRLWPKNLPPPSWNTFNIPVWALEEDGFLFVRTFSPRVNRSAVDVIEGGSLAMVPGAMDVSNFQGEMD